jgi:cytochrome oxidase Cu insertion factor (SCO1/SenC/PrrC family)
MYRESRAYRIYLLLLLAVAALPATAVADDTAIDFALIDHHGKTFQLHDLRGKVVLVFFGYTHCPDVCPIELQYMASALQRLDDAAQHARGLFISVDPEHDTPEVLSQYLQYFGAGITGLTGTQQQIELAAKQLKVSYRKESHADDRYTMEHTANLFVIDQRGMLSTIVPFGFPAAHIESLLAEMLAAAQQQD